MSAMSPEEAARPQPEPHKYRQTAEGFGAEAERYDRTRPRYPAAMIDRIVAASPGTDVLDVGAGTGIVARQFQAAGCAVLGVEPDPRMAGFGRDQGLAVEVATFEAWDPAGRTFDAVVAGQAWHWVDPVAGAAKAAQVLRPGGRIALFWNALQFPPDLRDALAAVYERVRTGLPFNPWARPALESYQIMCDKAADGLRQAGAFGDPDQWRFDWDQRYTRDEWLEQVPSIGGHQQIPPDAMAELLAGIGAAIDALGSSFTMSYATLVLTATRRDAA
jgi:SAM-dependent methyltransferase